MKRVTIWWVTLAVVLALLGGSWRSPAVIDAQDDEDLAATVEALQTRVADLEERVAAIEAGADEGGDAGETPRATRTPTTTGGQTDAADGTRTAPIPLWETALVGDYTVRVIEVVTEATDAVLAENIFNEPPAPGEQFYLVTVEVTYNGSTTGSPAFDLNFQAVGEASIAYSTYDNSCGVVPNDQFLANELFTGGTIRFNVCWSVPGDDANSLVMFVEPTFSFDTVPIFFALRAV